MGWMGETYQYTSNKIKPSPCEAERGQCGARDKLRPLETNEL